MQLKNVVFGKERKKKYNVECKHLNSLRRIWFSLCHFINGIKMQDELSVYAQIQLPACHWCENPKFVKLDDLKIHDCIMKNKKQKIEKKTNAQLLLQVIEFEEEE